MSKDEKIHVIRDDEIVTDMPPGSDCSISLESLRSALLVDPDEAIANGMSMLRGAHASAHYKDLHEEPVEYIEKNQHAWRHPFHVGNIIKYVSRYHFKDGLEDLKKAKWYLDRLIWLEEHAHHDPEQARIDAGMRKLSDLT